MSFNLKDYSISVGFIAGEGHIHCSNDTIMIRVAQIERTPLELLQQLYGGKIYGPYKYQTNQQPYWYWGVTGPRAAGVVMTLLPELKRVHVTRYQQGVDALKLWRERKMGAKYRTHCPRGHPYDEANTCITRVKSRMCRTCGRDKARIKRQQLAGG